MKLPIVDNIRDVITGRLRGYRSITNGATSVEFTESVDSAEPLGFDDFHVHRLSVEVHFQQIVPGGKLMREPALRAISRTIYNPVECELREILQLLRKEGLHNSEAATRIEAMFPALRGEIT